MRRGLGRRTPGRGQVPPGGRRALEGPDLEYFLSLVAAELGTGIICDRNLRDPEVAAEFNYAGLLPAIFGSRSVADWPGLVHAYYEPRRSMLARGVALLVATGTFEAARPLLRATWSGLSGGGILVERPGPVDGLNERLVLHGPSSQRFVTRQHLARWGIPEGEAFRVAEENGVALLDQVTVTGGPAHFAVALPNMYALPAAVRQLEEVAPDAVGRFGTLVVVPVPSMVLCLPLGRSDGLAPGLHWLVSTSLGAGDKALARPMLRTAEGSLRQVEMTVRVDGISFRVNLDDPFLRGVLAYIDPEPRLLPVASWAADVDPVLWTRFAGIAAAVVAPVVLGPDMVRHFGTTFGFPGLLRILRLRDPETWPDIVVGGIPDAHAAAGSTGGPETATAHVAELAFSAELDALRKVARHGKARIGVEVVEDQIEWIEVADKIAARRRPRLEIHAQGLTALPGDVARAVAEERMTLHHCTPECAARRDFVWLSDAPSEGYLN